MRLPSFYTQRNEESSNSKRFDMVLVWSLDRLGRSLQNLVELLNELQSMRIDLMLLQHGIGTSTSSGRTIFSIFDILAEFELALIRERVIAVQNGAKAKGVKMGRPSKINDGFWSAIQFLQQRAWVSNKKEYGAEIWIAYSLN